MEARLYHLIEVDPMRKYYPYTIQLGKEVSILKAKVKSNASNVFGLCHGAILFFWSDTLMHVHSSLATNIIGVTKRLEYKFIKPVHINTEITMYAKFDSPNVYINVFCNDILVGTANGTFAQLPSKL
jgi:acyl-coenzyme A thioesterase PaaI-like protein